MKDEDFAYEQLRQKRIDNMKTNEEYRLLEQQLAEREKQVVTLRDALFNQLNDCINFNGGQLTICIMEASTKALDATTSLAEQDQGVENGNDRTKNSTQ